MEAENSLTFRLESYLIQLSDVNRRWTAWLASSEQAAVSQDRAQLLALQGQAEGLFGELRQIITDRQLILDDAQQRGWSCPDLTTLAGRLSAGGKPGLRSSLSIARQHLANLRRLHIATWVLLNQAWQHCTDTLQLLMVGNQPHVYQSHSHRPGKIADSDGGRLLDATL